MIVSLFEGMSLVFAQSWFIIPACVMIVLPMICGAFALLRPW